MCPMNGFAAPLDVRKAASIEAATSGVSCKRGKKRRRERRYDIGCPQADLACLQKSEALGRER